MYAESTATARLPTCQHKATDGAEEGRQEGVKGKGPHKEGVQTLKAARRNWVCCKEESGAQATAQKLQRRRRGSDKQ